jgi:hypothetical protein
LFHTNPIAFLPRTVLYGLIMIGILLTLSHCGAKGNKSMRSSSTVIAPDEEDQGGSQDADRAEGVDELRKLGALGLTFPQYVRRLNREELRKSLVPIFGNTTLSDQAVANLIAGFDDRPTAGRYEQTLKYFDKGPLQTGIELAFLLAEKSTQVAQVRSVVFPGCAQGAFPMICIQNFLEKSVAQLWRRPLSAAEIAELATIGSTTTWTAEQVEILIARVLSSPHFLLHLQDLSCGDLGCATVSQENQNFAVASRLSYALTNAPPDSLLWEAAAAAEISDLNALRSHAERLLKSSEGQLALKSFFHEWLETEKIKTPPAGLLTHFAIAEASLHDLALQELESLFTYLIDRPYADVFGTRKFPLDHADLRKLYQVSTPNADELPADRGGVAGRVGFLLSSGLAPSIVSRGLQVRRNLLCLPMADPDDAIIAQRDDELGSLDRLSTTSRKILELKTSPSSCMGCHSAINPLGFVLDGFGPLGDKREKELVFSPAGEVLSQLNLETSTSLVDAGVNYSWKNEGDFFEFLRQSPQVKGCLIQRMFQFQRFIPRETAKLDYFVAMGQGIPVAESLSEIYMNLILREDILLPIVNSQ